ncbi:MAG: nickel-dependent hydrogenase large subunit [bacterium]
MNRTIAEYVPRIEGKLKVVQSDLDQEKSVFLESNRSLHMEEDLAGRYPLEATQTPQMLSAVNGVAHALAAVSALENYLQLDPTPASLQIRQMMLQLTTLHSHIRHFYWDVLPDYLNKGHFDATTSLSAYLRFDFRPGVKKEKDLSLKAGQQILGHIQQAARALDELQKCIALIGGKYPVVMNLIPGGVTNFSIDRSLLMKILRSLEQVKAFIQETWPEDVKSFIRDLPETVAVPVKRVNLISFGSLPSGKGDGAEVFYSNGFVIDGKLEPINELLITESLLHTFYLPVGKGEDPERGGFDINKAGGRTWMKGARYDGEPMMTGALSRMMITLIGGSHMEISDRAGKMIEDLGLSVESPNCSASRLLAEVLEARFYIRSILNLLLNFDITQPLNQKTAFDFSKPGSGSGRVESPGGAMLHQVFINDNRITQYRIVSSANWNFSTIDRNGKTGVVERELNSVLEKEALSIAKVNRIVHSYNAQILEGTH